MEIGRRIERKFYSSMWLSFLERFNIGRDAALFDDFGHCIGIKICKSIEDFSGLKVVETQQEPDSRVVLYGTDKIRITVWDNYLAIEKEV